MGYFDGIVDGGFKTTESGVILFYPSGIYGKGYIVPTIEKKQEIRKQLKRFNVFAFLVIVIPGSLFFPSIKNLLVPWWLAGLIYIAIIAGVSIAGRSVSKRLTNGLTQVDQKITLAEVYQNSAKSHDMTILGILELASVLFVIFGFWMALENGMAWYVRLTGVMSIIFFGLGSIGIGYLIKLKNKG